MKKILATLLMTLSLPMAMADSGSAALACQGTLKGQFYYVYWYQFVYVKNDVIQNENHSFNVQGFLSGESFSPNQAVSGPFVIYQSANYYLAVPWKSNSYGLWLEAKAQVAPSLESTSGWLPLCPK